MMLDGFPDENILLKDHFAFIIEETHNCSGSSFTLIRQVL
jgi:hypothetical protein